MTKYFVLFFISFSLWASCEHETKRFNCVKFLYNYDGDTITFDLPHIHPFFGKKTKIRVLGIDAPEKKSHHPRPCELEWARAAQRLVEAELKNAKRIDLIVPQGLDKYGRILADVVYDGKSLSEVLLRNYLAVTYLGKTKQNINWCKEMEKARHLRKKL